MRPEHTFLYPYHNLCDVPVKHVTKVRKLRTTTNDQKKKKRKERKRKKSDLEKIRQCSNKERKKDEK